MFRVALALVAIAVPLILVSGATAAPRNVLLARSRTEPTVAVDPGNPRIVVGSANTDYSSPVGDTFPTAYFASRNGGLSFSTGTAPVVFPYTTGADTTVAVARDGTVFYSYLGESSSYCSGGRSAIILTHSIDHATSFRTPTVVDVDPADDKPNMAVQSMRHGASHIYISWTRWHDNSSDLWVARSVNGGASFGRPLRLYTSPRNNFGSVPLVAAQHHVYVFWSAYPDVHATQSAPTTIMVARSSDGGAHFRKPLAVGRGFQAVPSMAQPGLLRVLTMPAVAAGADGTLYLAWAQVERRYPDGHVDADIRIVQSHDFGSTWSSPTRVNDSGRNDRFMPAMQILPDGSLGIAYYDRRNGTSHLDVYAARVLTGEPLSTGRNVRVDAGNSSIWDIPYIPPGSTCFSPGRFFGDYIGVAAGGTGSLCVVWTDTQLRISGETDVRFARVALTGHTSTLERVPVKAARRGDGLHRRTDPG